MKKLLSALTAIGVLSCSMGTVVSCKPPKIEDKSIHLDSIKDSYTVKSAKFDEEFIRALIKQINTDNGFDDLKSDLLEIDIQKTENHIKTYIPVTTNNLENWGTKTIKVKSLDNDSNVKGEKVIVVDWKDIRIDLNDIDQKTLNLKSIRDVIDFKEKLISKVSELSGVQIDLNDVKITNSNGDPIVLLNIQTQPFIVKVSGIWNNTKVSLDVASFTINWTNAQVDLENIAEKELNVNSSKYYKDFKDKVLVALNKEIDGVKLTLEDVILSKAGSVLDIDSSFVNGPKLEVRIRANDSNLKVKGDATFLINWTEDKLDLSSVDEAYVNIQTVHEVYDFKYKLAVALSKYIDVVTLTHDDFILYNANGNAFTTEDIKDTRFNVIISGVENSAKVKTTSAKIIVDRIGY